MTHDPPDPVKATNAHKHYGCARPQCLCPCRYRSPRSMSHTPPDPVRAARLHTCLITHQIQLRLLIFMSNMAAQDEGIPGVAKPDAGRAHHSRSRLPGPRTFLCVLLFLHRTVWSFCLAWAFKSYALVTSSAVTKRSYASTFSANIAKSPSSWLSLLVSSVAPRSSQEKEKGVPQRVFHMRPRPTPRTALKQPRDPPRRFQDRPNI